jgi:hypothetical protein
VSARLLGTLAGAVWLTACTGTPAPAPAAPPEPPPPPAACLLDTDALRVATGLTWAPDDTTASDTRCVYDPGTGTGTEFVVVDVDPPAVTEPPTPLDEPTPLDDPTPVDDIAAVCAGDTRVPAGSGFVCRLPAGGVFAATVRDGALVTLAAAAVPAATTADALGTAFAEQLTLLG